VLYLGYASFVLLKLVCVLCLITYASVIGLFLVSGAAMSFPMRTLPRRAAQDLRVLIASPLALVLTVVLVGGAVSTLAFFPREAATEAPATDAGGDAAGAPPAATAAQRSEFERYYTAQPRLTLVVPTEGAKVLIVKFNDYQCPPCRQTFMEYKSVLEKYATEQPGAVRLVTRDFPLERECNAGVTTDLHASACEAAVAVRLAREKKRAEQMEQWLFDNQSKLTPDLVRQGARDVGQVTDFEARYASTLEAVKADIAYGRQLGVNGTPTFFVNGVRIGGLASVYFDQAIAYELARAGQ
jgi:protein-disulfide isomerase